MNEPSASYERLRRLGISSWSIAGVALVVAGIVWVLYLLRILWPPLVLAGAVVYLMSPLVDRMQKWRIHRLVGSFVSYLLFLGLGVLFGFLVVPIIGDQLAEFSDQIPQLVDDIGVFLVDLGEGLGLSVGAGSALETLQEWLADFFDQENIQQMLTQVGTFARAGLDVLIILALGPVLAFYILVELPGFKDTFPAPGSCEGSPRSGSRCLAGGQGRGRFRPRSAVGSPHRRHFVERRPGAAGGSVLAADWPHRRFLERHTLHRPIRRRFSGCGSFSRLSGCRHGAVVGGDVHGRPAVR